MASAGDWLDFDGRDEFLREPENAAAYLDEILQEGDIERFAEALRHVAKARELGFRSGR
jgi:DNA-binding phage protein